METVIWDAGDVAEIADEPVPTSLHRDRYKGISRATGALVSGIVSGVLLINSIQVGVAFAVGQGDREWDVLDWGDHWMWRGVASIAATSAAAFLAAMIARRRGRLIGALSATPSALYWALIAYAGFVGRIPGISETVDVPLGYRLVAVLLAVGTIPCGAACGQEGSSYGRANARHFDDRRGTLLGVRWYHFLWLPVLIHLMVMTGAFGAVYGFQWMTAVWQSGMSILGFVPVIFVMAMFATLQLLVTGGMGAYEALAGFEDGSGNSTFRRVMKFGFGYTIASALAQTAIALVHYGLVTVLG